MTRRKVVIPCCFWRTLRYLQTYLPPSTFSYVEVLHSPLGMISAWGNHWLKSLLFSWSDELSRSPKMKMWLSVGGKGRMPQCGLNGQEITQGESEGRRFAWGKGHAPAGPGSWTVVLGLFELTRRTFPGAMVLAPTPPPPSTERAHLSSSKSAGPC